MGREENLNIILNEFDKCAKAFCLQTDGAFCEVSSEYNGEEKPQNIKYRFAKIYYNSFVAEFKYTAHSFMNVSNSILECLVYLDKTKEVFGIPLQLLTDYCGVDIAVPLSIPIITNALGMRQAFECIGGVLEDLLPKVESISYDNGKKAEIIAAFINEIKCVFDETDTEEPVLEIGEYVYQFFTLRFTSDAFVCFLKGKRKKAVKKLSKLKKMTGYEKRLLKIWETAEQIELSQISVIVKNAEIYNDSGVPNANFKEFGALFLSWIIMTLPIAAIFVGFYHLLVFIEGREAVYLMGTAYNYPYCILFGFVISIAVSYFTRFKFYKFFYKKDYERYCEVDYIQNGGKDDRLMKGFLKVLVILSFIGCLLLAKWNINFSQDGFVDNSKFFSLKGEYHSYSEVKKVYYMPNRVNGFGETIDYPSYVLVLKNGKEIDFYELDEIERYEEKLISFLRDKGVKVED